MTTYTSSDSSGFFGIGLLVLIGMVLVALLLFTSCGPNYSNGTRTGVITKLSNKGLCCKTWEGQMNLGGMVRDGDGGAVANTWEFTIETSSADMINEINRAASEGRRVSLTYHEWFKRPVFRTDTGYMVTGISDPSVVEMVRP